MTTVDFDPLSPGQLADPFPLYARLRSECPVFYAERYDLWVVSRYEDVLRVAKDYETFSSVNALAALEPLPEVQAVLAEGYPELPIIVASDPPLHTQIRGLVNRSFTGKRVAAMAPTVRRIATELIDGFVEDGNADLVERFAYPLPLIVLGDLVGIPREDLHWISERTDGWLRLGQRAGTIEDQLRYARGFVELQGYYTDALESRGPAPRDDLLTELYNGRDEVSMAALTGLVLDLIAAGHVVVTRTIGSAMLMLLERPDVVARIRAQPEFVAPVVEEILRLEMPTQGLFRLVTRDVELGGVTVPAGAKVMVHYGSANRDEAVFADPETFDPDRDDLSKSISFGRGNHSCLGPQLARLELQTAVTLLLERLPGLRLAPGDAFDRTELFFARGIARLELEWDPAA
jgi:cytochrome P450